MKYAVHDHNGAIYPYNIVPFGVDRDWLPLRVVCSGCTRLFTSLTDVHSDWSKLECPHCHSRESTVAWVGGGQNGWVPMMSAKDA